MQINQSYAGLPGILHTPAELAPVEAPRLLLANDALADELGIERDWLHSDHALQILSGNVAAGHDQPLAMAYAGHQFGGFSPSLGDGRAMLVGDIVLPNGSIRELHLKGSGRTIYSRGGDGRATLSAMLREYILSEAMDGLGIPTTRSLAVVGTGERVWRQKPEMGAVLTRVATSHVRVGTFQYLAARNEVQAIRALMNHEIARHMPSVDGPYEFLREVISRQARLIAQWMGFGFIHGVMNTDNMQIAGETIDYGPCAFMDGFDPNKVFSSIDEQGRYAWDKQPAIALWNLTRLAECLLPLLNETRAAAIKIAEQELENFMPQFETAFEQRMLAKLGISDESQGGFVGVTLQHMTNAQADFTRFFTALTRGDHLAGFFVSPQAHDEWMAQWKALQTPDARALMQAHNPAVIARNHRVEAALNAAEGDNWLPLHHLVGALRMPFAEQREFADLELGPLAHEEVVQTFCGT